VGGVNGFQQSTGRIVVPASSTFGATLEFHDERHARQNDRWAALHSMFESIHDVQVLRAISRVCRTAYQRGLICLQSDDHASAVSG
jgi:hypothetical protein